MAPTTSRKRVKPGDDTVQLGQGPKRAHPDTVDTVEAMRKGTWCSNAQFKVGYVFRAELKTTSAPAISRILRVPSTDSFHKLHMVLQTAFGWSDASDYEFGIHIADHTTSSRRMVFSLESRNEGRYQSILSAEEKVYFKSPKSIKLFHIFESLLKDKESISIDYNYGRDDNW